MSAIHSYSCKLDYTRDNTECLNINECELEAYNYCNEVAKCDLTYVKLSNVKPMQYVSIYQLILNVSAKTDTVSLVNL